MIQNKRIIKMSYKYIVFIIMFCFSLAIYGQTLFSNDKFIEVKSSIDHIKSNSTLMLSWLDQDIPHDIRQELLFYIQYGYLLNNQNDYNKELFDSLLSKQYSVHNSYAINASIDLTQKHISQKKYAEAIISSQRIIDYYIYNENKLDSLSISYAYYLKGHSLLFIWKLEEAKTNLTQSVNYFPIKKLPSINYASALYDLAMIEFLKKEYKQAANYAQKTFHITQQNISYYSDLYYNSALLLLKSLNQQGNDELVSKYGTKLLKSWDEDETIIKTLKQVYYIVGCSFHNIKQYNKANYYLKKAEKLYLKTDTTNILYADLLTSIGQTKYGLNEYIEAVNYFKKAANIKCNILGEKDMEYLTILEYISSCYDAINNKHEAILTAEKICNILKKNNIKNSSWSTIIYYRLSKYYYNNGEYDKAFTLGKEAFLLSQKYIDKSNPEYAQIHSAFSRYKMKIGKVDDAIESENKTLALNKINKNKLGIAISYENLGNAYTLKQDIESAITFIENSIKAYEEIDVLSTKEYNKLGISVLSYYYKTLTLLCGTYTIRGDYSKAIIVAQKCLEGIKRVFNEKHHLYSETLGYLSQCYYFIGNKEMFLFYTTKYLDATKNIYKTTDNNYAEVLKISSSMYNNKMEYLKAKELISEAIDIYKTNKMEHTNEYYAAKAILADIYIGLGEYDKAINTINKFLPQLNKNHFLYGKVTFMLSQIYTLTGAYDNAIIHGFEVLSTIEQILGNKNLNYLQILELLS